MRETRDDVWEKRTASSTLQSAHPSSMIRQSILNTSIRAVSGRGNQKESDSNVRARNRHVRDEIRIRFCSRTRDNVILSNALKCSSRRWRVASTRTSRRRSCRCRAKLHGIFKQAQRYSKDGRFFLLLGRFDQLPYCTAVFIWNYDPKWSPVARFCPQQFCCA